ncbi:hypothetical protein PS934_05888 [Pseudomonas fluorescens]|nr:hypothetical protein PS934_05888 [Pseudomonas fluorescens]
MFKQVALGRNRIPAQEVSDVHFLDVVDLYPTAGQVHETGNASNVKRETFEITKNFTPPPTV